MDGTENTKELITGVNTASDSQVKQAIELLRDQGYDISKAVNPGGKKRIKLAFYGDAPSVATGFGKVSSNILPNLYDTGDYDIMCFGVNYWGLPHQYPFQIYPMLPNPQNDPYGREKILRALPEVDFDIGFFLQDSFIMTFLPQLISEMRKRGKKFRTLAYFPIDGTPWPEWIQAMSAVDIPVTYTEWGKRECIKVFPAIADRLQVIPHGISVKEFFPYPENERRELRKKYFGELADKFIVLNVNRNQQRKDIPRSMAAFKEFKKECPDSVYYLHMAMVDVGWNLEKVSKHLGLAVGKDVVFPENFDVNRGFPVKIVNELYNCADACISTTLGGGWELSSVEAMACKVPIVFPDNTALTEICAEGRGFLCRSGDTINMKSILPMDNDIIRPLTNINDMVKYLKRLYEDWKAGGRLKQKMTDKGYEWVHKNLIWEKNIVPRFDSYLKALYEDLNRVDNVSLPTERKGWDRGEII